MGNSGLRDAVDVSEKEKKQAYDFLAELREYNEMKKKMDDFFRDIKLIPSEKTMKSKITYAMARWCNCLKEWKKFREQKIRRNHTDYETKKSLASKDAIDKRKYACRLVEKYKNELIEKGTKISKEIEEKTVMFGEKKKEKDKFKIQMKLENLHKDLENVTRRLEKLGVEWEKEFNTVISPKPKHNIPQKPIYCEIDYPKNRDDNNILGPELIPYLRNKIKVKGLKSLDNEERNLFNLYVEDGKFDDLKSQINYKSEEEEEDMDLNDKIGANDWKNKNRIDEGGNIHANPVESDPLNGIEDDRWGYEEELGITTYSVEPEKTSEASNLVGYLKKEVKSQSGGCRDSLSKDLLKDGGGANLYETILEDDEDKHKSIGSFHIFSNSMDIGLSPEKPKVVNPNMFEAQEIKKYYPKSTNFEMVENNLPSVNNPNDMKKSNSYIEKVLIHKIVKQGEEFLGKRIVKPLIEKWEGFVDDKNFKKEYNKNVEDKLFKEHEEKRIPKYKSKDENFVKPMNEKENEGRNENLIYFSKEVNEKLEKNMLRTKEQQKKLKVYEDKKREEEDKYAVEIQKEEEEKKRKADFVRKLMEEDKKRKREEKEEKERKIAKLREETRIREETEKLLALRKQQEEARRQEFLRQQEEEERKAKLLALKKQLEAEEEEETRRQETLRKSSVLKQKIELQYCLDEEIEIGRLKKILENRRFSDFKIYKRLGISKKKGFYGVNCAVYLCGLEQTNDIFVMKIVFNYFHENTNAIDINLLQSEIVDIPFHSNIASCLYSFIDEVDYWKLPKFNVEVELLVEKTALFVFKYYPRTLQNYIRTKNHSLSDFDILLKLRQLIKGVCYLQEKSISHRDLKPDNVFLDWDCTKCLIGDFGCCLKDSEFRFRFSKQMERGYAKGGAPYYLAPEILTCKGDSFIDYSKNDIFSVGLIGCKMIQEEGVLINDNTQIIGFNKGVKTDQRIINFLLKLVSPNPNNRLDCLSALKEIEILLETIFC